MNTSRLSLLLGLVSLLLSACAHAQVSGIIDGTTLQPTNLSQALAQVTPGSIVVIGENHGFKTHQDQQLQIMTQLRRQGLKVSVGLEFFTFTDQPFVDQNRQGSLNEADFLKAINWGSPSFEFYKAQANFADLAQNARTLALNAPRTITSKVAKTGLSSLDESEKALLPPQFHLGRDSYRRRFLAQMPHLPDPASGERYFAAQSIWDDTMAWRATDFMAQHPEQVLVIVVGDFHVQYGGGLPDRLLARRPQTPVWTFSQVNTSDLSPEEIDAEIAPSPEDGSRAQFLWLAPAL
jgi:uncharacterized iron-regulated protein